MLIDLDPGQDAGALGLRVGSQVTAMIYTGENWLFNLLGRLYIRLNALATYAY